MKLKHFAGYGTITATKVSKRKNKQGKTILQVKVIGNHECGLIRDDIYTLKTWLIDRFDRSIKDMPIRDIYNIMYSSEYLIQYNADKRIDEESVLYTFVY